MLVKCPKCKCDIESDSYFCDQCGAELYICTKCRTFGRGKRCTQCGTELVKASEFKGEAINPLPATASVPAQAPSMPIQTHTSPGEKTIRPGAPVSSLQPGHLVCPLYGIRLGLDTGVIIGRRGHYASVFGVFADVSGNHARIDQNGNEWTVTDLGSTNGTFLNGQALQPNVPQPIHIGDTIRFSTVEFKVQI